MEGKAEVNVRGGMKRKARINVEMKVEVEMKIDRKRR